VSIPLPGPDFTEVLAGAGHPAGLGVGELEIFQVNIGKLCNMRCRHCHVDASPEQTVANMDRRTVDACLHALDQTPAHTVDITGGAPELNPHFTHLVEGALQRGKHVIDRCNLTVLLHPRKPATDAQRGEGTWDRSIEALRKLNAVGYGTGDPRRRLTLMHNPAGAWLPGSQASLEREWKGALQRSTGVTFDRLIALNNMPISRFLDWLVGSGNLDAYMERLHAAFNPAAVSGLMCRNTLSIGWDGTLYDCDFNQMLSMPLAGPASIFDFDYAALRARRVVVDRHCFGCTAGAGSSCGGSTA
jgi:MoaA/NifB/PqqE/SkfB family radical SAM enzyme